MKFTTIICATALTVSTSMAFAGGHAEGRINAALNVLEKNKNAEVTVMAPRIIGDNGKGNGGEPFAATADGPCLDHDPQTFCGDDDNR